MKLWPLLFLLYGCAATYVLVGTPRAPIDPSQVTIYLSTPDDAEEIAIIEAPNQGGFTDQGKVDSAVASLKRTAAALGANGVVLRGIGTESTSGIAQTVGTTAIYGGARHKTVTGVAIFTPPAQQ
jgi:hypothetical protein